MITIDFLTAGYAIFTVSSPKTRHYTFRVKALKAQEGKEGVPVKSYDGLFVSVLTGPENTSDYTYMGVIEKSYYGEWRFRITRASRYNPGTPVVEVFEWALAVIKSQKTLPEGYAIEHMGRCGRCGRPLTDPDSIRLGIGPKCRGDA